VLNLVISAVVSEFADISLLFLSDGESLKANFVVKAVFEVCLHIFHVNVVVRALRTGQTWQN
jgi:hypothetical protein